MSLPRRRAARSVSPYRVAIPVALAMLAAIAALVAAGSARAENPTPYPGTQVMPTSFAFDDLVQRLEAAVKSNKMGIVTRASATKGAASIGVAIPGNMVIGVYRPDFAVRMLESSVAAGIEAPLRFYLTEKADGTATLTYRTPSSVFAPYESDKLDVMAKELDAIFARIALEATGG